MENKKNYIIIQSKERYNSALGASRSLIERTWILLKGKWRRLHWIDVDNLAYLNYWVITACCFHNFTIDIPFAGLDEPPIDDDVDEDENFDERADQLEANEKRNRIANYLSEARDTDDDSD